MVVERDRGVTDLAFGDEVYGLIRFGRDGAAAEYFTVPAADLARRPRTVSHVLAAPLGAVVTATIRSDGADEARSLGATHVVDVRIGPFDQVPAGYDVVIAPSEDRCWIGHSRCCGAADGW